MERPAFSVSAGVALYSIGTGTLTFSGYNTFEGTINNAHSVPEAYLAALPRYRELARETVRKDLGLTADQQKELAQIASKFGADQGEIEKKATEQPAEWWKSRETLQTEVGRRIEGLLTPQQLTALKNVRVRDVSPFYVQSDPYVQDKIGLSEPQRAAMREIVRGEEEKGFNREQEIYGKLLGLLTPQQQEKLREAMSKAAW